MHSPSTIEKSKRKKKNGKPTSSKAPESNDPQGHKTIGVFATTLRLEEGRAGRAASLHPLKDESHGKAYERT